MKSIILIIAFVCLPIVGLRSRRRRRWGHFFDWQSQLRIRRDQRIRRQDDPDEHLQVVGAAALDNLQRFRPGRCYLTCHALTF
jgi:hypothetical protein